MTEIDIVGLGIGIAGLVVGVIGTGIALYQWGVMNEAKKRRHELQYLLAGISNTALLRRQSWLNQLSLYPAPQGEADLNLKRMLVRARDDLSEIHSLVAALEGAVDSEKSATTEILKKTIEQGELNNRIQKLASQNQTDRP
ncbi:hypothetical protein [Idiomarina ramblicola]|uniref:Uncharacterized protein n=1 Tax=Idiomarina ramblicola TaxID=263724 RepID=A0A432Z179_9GAMM|nr:hypothetical protein [Idiomarina ramblicola]RUO71652.1 hypothetical protein CWI78_03820 [Idiomarina ramblicola]